MQCLSRAVARWLRLAGPHDTGSNALPYQDETLCVAAPIVRGSVMSSGGTPGSCDGSYVVPFGQAQITALGLGVGDDVYVQFWYRDPGDALYASSFSDAVWFLVVP